MKTATVITFSRLLAAPLFVIFLIYFHQSGRVSYYYLTLGLWLALGISDAVDGYIARRFNQVTKFGMVMDPLADKIMMISAFTMFALYGHLPIYLSFVAITRDMLILIVAGFTLMIRGEVSPPNWLSKVNTGLQVALIFVVLIEMRFPGETVLLIKNILSILVLVFIFLSGITYLVRFIMNSTLWANGN